MNAASGESAPPRGYFRRALDDVVALALTAIEVGRRGALAAIVATLGLVVVGVVIGGVCSAFAILTTPLVLIVFAPLFLIAIALVQAAPLAAFGLAARSEEVRLRDAFGLAIRRAPGLVLLDLGLAFFAGLVLLSGCCLAWAAAVLGYVVLLVIVFAEVRWFLLAQVVVVVGEDPSLCLREAHRLGMGRFPVLLVAALVPLAIQLLAHPSDVGLKAADDLGANLDAVRVAVGAAGWIASFFIGALLAASAWKVVSRPR
jgi:hypothetical protein